MTKYFIYLPAIMLFGAMISLSSCKKDDDGGDTPDPGESTTELLVKKFDAAPTLDGTIDDMWATAQRLVG